MQDLIIEMADNLLILSKNTEKSMDMDMDEKYGFGRTRIN